MPFRLRLGVSALYGTAESMVSEFALLEVWPMKSTGLATLGQVLRREFRGSASYPI